MVHDISAANKHCETAISLALSIQNTKLQCRALTSLAWIHWSHGDYFTAQVHANKAVRLARILADLHSEAQALLTVITCCYSLGNYKQSIFLCSRARDLLALCGMSSGELDHGIMTSQAETHKLKSEYVAARNIHSRILQETSVDQDFHTYGLALLNVAEIDVPIGAPKEDVQNICEKARGIFNTAGHVLEVIMCDMTLADLNLREGNFLAAKTLFKRCLKLSKGHSEIITYCLERLGDASRWGDPNGMSSWTTVFLVHSARQKERLGIHKALQFLGDAFLAAGDEHIAVNLFTVALKGFTYMDVHRSKAESMLRLGDISKGKGDLLKAVELWTAARPLFERSSQAKQVENIDQRLAGVSEDVWEQHRKNFAHLAELTAPSGTVDKISNLSEIKDMEGLDLEDETALDLVAL
jgi:tetratricopeptide (TPR) repeat protein